jgi:hypothetical protein
MLHLDYFTRELEVSLGTHDEVSVALIVAKAFLESMQLILYSFNATNF